MPAKWHLLFTFPSFVPRADTPYVSREVAICSADDPRVRRHLADDPTRKSAQLLLRRFSTESGEGYRPGCLLVRQDAPDSVRTFEALSSFRNLSAIATTTQGWGAAIDHDAQWVTLWNDTFRFGHYTPARRGGGFVTLDGPILGWESDARIRRMRIHAAFQIGRPARFTARVDEALLARLIVAWRQFYVAKKKQSIWRRLFRSLEVAFHAGLFPSDGLTTLNDAGTRIGLWVSAFEVLFHPGRRGRVDKETVQRQLERVPWSSKRLTARRYRVRQRHGPKRPAMLAESIYEYLYDARNAFLHGNNVTLNHLRYRRSAKYESLLTLAPVLYHGALLAFLRGKVHRRPGTTIRGRTSRAFVGHRKRSDGLSNIERALLKAAQPIVTEDE